MVWKAMSLLRSRVHEAERRTAAIRVDERKRQHPIAILRGMRFARSLHLRLGLPYGSRACQHSSGRGTKPPQVGVVRLDMGCHERPDDAQDLAGSYPLDVRSAHLRRMQPMRPFPLGLVEFTEQRLLVRRNGVRSLARRHLAGPLPTR